ncbi:hypothetical protein [Denitromonas ohlonensis]|uniref:Uncharacterized protein n=2 Tax=Denitromonas TaxID=139331 RepID=A0A557SIV6_9RHOO|nr:hypothetical protein [Denitromonas ohlonensis]TVO69251.1 hypothetical protein FHP90_01290 [Denitromonas ohlonensis]TVO77351.1 hypothetical protein FHP89_08520 [Denitromonas ohlonensis]
MYLERIRLDRVFDVQLIQHGRGARLRTLFSFESGPTRQFGVSVEGQPAMADGMEIVAAMRRHGDWQSLVAFLNCRSLEFAGRSPRQEALLCAMLIALFLVSLLLRDGWGLTVLRLVSGIGVLMFGWSGFKAYRLRQTLRRFRTSVPD